MQRGIIIRWIALLIIAVSGYLALHGLADNFIWDDEAETALYAQNLLRFGSLTSWDGRNLITRRNGVHLDLELINRFNSPLQFCITAVSFQCLGESTFSARLPFVILGLTAAWFFFLLLRLESRNNVPFSLIGLILLLFSPSFLLYIRQCHYYSLILLFSVLVYYQYKKYIYYRKIFSLVLCVVCFLCLFLSHYLTAVAFGFAIFGLHLSFYIRKRPMYPYLIAGLIVVSAILIYMHLYKVIIPHSSSHLEAKTFSNKLFLFIGYFRDINGFNWFPWSMLIVLSWLALDKSFNPDLKRKVKEWILMSVIFIVVVTILYPVSADRGDLVDIRYILPLLPFFSALLGVVIYFLKKKYLPVAIIALLLLILTNIFSLNLWFPRKLRFDLINYIYEIHNDYITAYEAATDFIQKNCNDNDSIVVIPPNMSYPLQFYAGKKVVLAGRMDYNTNIPLSKVRELNPSLIVEEARPDWIISFRLRPSTNRILTYYLNRGMKFDLYRVLNTYYLGELARPEILLHGYKPVTQFIPEHDGILIYKRR